ncbi:hypothetical protein EC991_008510 [Linnemannia zychae]|nr:hypothetical protein EC991_008510 [Linnemannia zychae]
MDSALAPPAMDSASTRLLNIPELVEEIVSSLDKNNISQLMQASHGFYNMFAPYLYQHLDLMKTPQRLITQPVFMQALSRHASHVRAIKMSAAFGMTYYDGVLLQQHQQQSNLEAISTVDQPPFNFTSAGNMDQPIEDIMLLPPIPFSPFTHLLKLSFVLITSSEHVHRVRTQALSDSGELITRLCAIVDFSPRLRSLSLSGIHIKTGALLNHLATTLAGLTNLEWLSLGLLSPHTDQDRFITTLFHYFPSMLQHLSLRIFFFSPARGKVKEPPPSSTSTDSQQLLRRSGPLRHLTYIDLVCRDSFNHDTFFIILKMCPNLISFQIPRIELQGALEATAQMVVQCCPRLQNLRHSNGSHDKEGRMLLAVAGLVDKDTLRSIDFCGLFDKKDMMERIVERHSGSLNTITLTVCSTISAKSLQAILFHCSLLTSLEVSGDDPEKFKISLEDAIAKPWASSKLKVLHLVIDIGDINTLLQDRQDPTAWLLDDARKKHLEKLFRQIGKQMELQDLDLRVAISEDNWDINSDDGDNDGEERDAAYDNFFFPGFLTLSDEATGRFGFLELLAGLSNLRCLLGSLAVGHSKNGCVMGQRECEWIVKHWPKLREARLYAAKDDVDTSSCISWLQSQLPRLNICSAYSP